MQPCNSRKQECIFICRLRRFKNELLLILGFTLETLKGYQVKLVDGKQLWSNNKRRRPYGFDDISWKISKKPFKGASRMCEKYYSTTETLPTKAVGKTTRWN